MESFSDTYETLPPGISWQSYAECGKLAARGKIDPELFQPKLDDDMSDRVKNEEARIICGRCPVANFCLQQALKENEPRGVWGGMSVNERKRALSHVGPEVHITLQTAAFLREHFGHEPMQPHQLAALKKRAKRAAEKAAKQAADKAAKLRASTAEETLTSLAITTEPVSATDDLQK